MFNVGGMELLVIAVLALIVLGPDKLPGAIRQVGNVVGELRRISSGFQTDLRGALDEAEREASEKANAAAPSSDTPDPGAARAAAHAELEAAEAALAADHDPPSESRSSAADAGSEGSPEASSSIDDEDSTRAAS